MNRKHFAPREARERSGAAGQSQMVPREGDGLVFFPRKPPGIRRLAVRVVVVVVGIQQGYAPPGVTGRVNRLFIFTQWGCVDAGGPSWINDGWVDGRMGVGGVRTSAQQHDWNEKKEAGASLRDEGGGEDIGGGRRQEQAANTRQRSLTRQGPARKVASPRTRRNDKYVPMMPLSR